MGNFKETEKRRLSQFKIYHDSFSDQAKVDGQYRGITRPFCLPREFSEENLFPEIRDLAVERFKISSIKWHDGVGSKPSNHLCDSQVSCVNFLMPFYNKPESLAELLAPHFPNMSYMMPIENEWFISFEWIGEENYLQERTPQSGKRTRGANCTSTDAAVMFMRSDHKQQIVLIEWKYTESYGSNPLAVSKSGTDRLSIYQPIFSDENCPLDKSILPGFESLFYEPFYQLMRQQFLAYKMEENNELGADIVSLFHIVPKANHDFQKITSPELAGLGESPTDIWKQLINPADRFLSLTTEELFSSFVQDPPESLQTWAEYLSARYPWISQ